MRVIDPRNGKQAPLDHDLQPRWAKEFAEWSRQECKHERQELRRGTNNAGMPVIRMQCLDCGLRVGQAVKRPPNADELPEFDDAMHDAYNAARKGNDAARQSPGEEDARRKRRLAGQFGAGAAPRGRGLGQAWGRNFAVETPFFSLLLWSYIFFGADRAARVRIHNQ